MTGMIEDVRDELESLLGREEDNAGGGGAAEGKEEEEMSVLEQRLQLQEELEQLMADLNAVRLQEWVRNIHASTYPSSTRGICKKTPKLTVCGSPEAFSCIEVVLGGKFEACLCSASGSRQRGVRKRPTTTRTERPLTSLFNRYLLRRSRVVCRNVLPHSVCVCAAQSGSHLAQTRQCSTRWGSHWVFSSGRSLQGGTDSSKRYVDISHFDHRMHALVYNVKTTTTTTTTTTTLSSFLG